MKNSAQWSVRSCQWPGNAGHGSGKIPRSHRAFTLIEIMVVCGIIAVVMMMAIPFTRDALGGGKGMIGASRSVQEAFSQARAAAVLGTTEVDLVIRRQDRSFTVQGAGAAVGENRLDSPDVEGKEWRMSGKPAASGGGSESMGFSVKLPDKILIEGIGINGEDWTEDEVARVRFYPNGTSDECSLILLDPEKNERRNIWVDVVTGLADIEVDPQKFKAK